MLQSQGKLDEAEPLCIEAVEGRRAVLGLNHADTIMSESNIAMLKQRQGKLQEAEVLYLRVLTSREASLGADHPKTLSSLSNLAAVMQKQHKYDDAERLMHQLLAANRRSLSSEQHLPCCGLAAAASCFSCRGPLLSAFCHKTNLSASSFCSPFV